MSRPSLSQIRPDLTRRRPQRPPRAVKRLLRDVEALAEVVADTIERLDARGLDDLARPLEDALVRLAGKRMPNA